MVFFIDEQYLGLVGDNMSLEKKIKEKDKRIEKLEELLKECREALGFAQGFYGYCKIKNYPCVNTNNFKDDESKIETCLTKIDEVLND